MCFGREARRIAEIVSDIERHPRIRTLRHIERSPNRENLLLCHEWQNLLSRVVGKLLCNVIDRFGYLGVF